MTSAAAHQQFLDEVFPAELEEIRRRRTALRMGGVPLGGAPSTGLGLVGLAFSGGGIRSATFGLGVVQALARHKLLPFVDYVSTVSGGGYIGSCLSSLLNAPHWGPEPRRFPLHHQPGIEEPPAVRHLRNSGNYIAPGGVLDKVRIPTLFLRGILVNLFVLLPYIMLAVVLTELIYNAMRGTGAIYRIAPLLTLAAFFALVLTYPFVARLFQARSNWTQRNRYDFVLTSALLAFFATAVVVPFIALVHQAIDRTWSESKDWVVAFSHGTLQATHHWPFLAVMGLLVAFMLAGLASARVSRWTGKASLAFLGLLGPSAVLGIYLLLVVVQIGSPSINARFQNDLDRAEITAAFHRVLADKGVPVSSAARVEVTRPGESWRIVDGEQTYPIHREGERLVIEEHAFWDGPSDWIFFGAGALFLLLNLFFVDVNITSVHGFYRDRLSRAYLIRAQEDGSVVANDRQKLSDLNAPGSAAPYHLLNVALNVPASEDPNLRGRRADFFILSKHFTGGPRTGYCQTRQMEAADGHFDLGTAMAISGAAAAPNMGITTVPALVFIMTMLNIRLGYWLPNPRTVRARRWYRRLLLPAGAGPRYLWREATGRLDEHGRHVNVSDGGHLENLGVYELLRRRCKLILAVDGECDPLLRFGSLVQLIRFARIDMGVSIDIDLEAVRPDAASLTKQPFALGTITYGEGEVGHLVYIKSSLTGAENEYVRDYRFRHPVFPHESTSDQFFDETQFEVYRALGYHIANRLGNDPRVQETLKKAGLPVPVL